MSQYINLLGPAFRKQQLLLTLGRTAMLLLAVAAVMLGVQAYERHRLAGLKEELASAQMLLKVQTAHTDRLKGDLANRKGSSGLDEDVRRLELELKSARDNIDVLEGGALGNRKGFADYLQAFSRQSLDGLWLTGFTVGGGGDVAINGRVTRADLVPVYIQKLNSEPALKGRAFSALDLRRPAPPPAAGPAPAVPPEAPRFLEFALTSVDAAADAAGEKK